MKKLRNVFFKLPLIDKKQYMYKLIHVGNDFYKFLQNWKNN